MGTRVHEGPSAGQSERKPSNSCAGNFFQFPYNFHSCCLFFIDSNLCPILQIPLKAAKEYSEQLGVDACIKLFEQFKSYEGLYFFLGSYLSSRYLNHMLISFKHCSHAPHVNIIFLCMQQ
jgi:hypothetical protein